MPKYTYRQQMLSTKTVAKIAKQVHEAETPKLIHRLYLFAQYEPIDNLWEDLTPTASIVDWNTNAKVVNICAIPKIDQATIPIGPNLPTQQPEVSRDVVAQMQFDLPNLITPQFTMNGKRSSDQIKIYGLSALLRLEVHRHLESTTTYTDKVTFRYGFYKYTKITADGKLDNAEVPNVKSLVKWQHFGYSAQLDNQITVLGSGQGQGMPYATENLNMLMNSEKIQTLAQGEVTLNVSSIAGAVNTRVMRIYKKIDMENLQFDPANITGEKTLNYKVLFAIRSDLPTYLIGDIEPRCQGCCVKVHYTNVD